MNNLCHEEVETECINVSQGLEFNPPRVSKMCYQKVYLQYSFIFQSEEVPWTWATHSFLATHSLSSRTNFQCKPTYIVTFSNKNIREIDRFKQLVVLKNSCFSNDNQSFSLIQTVIKCRHIRDFKSFPRHVRLFFRSITYQII